MRNDQRMSNRNPGGKSPSEYGGEIDRMDVDVSRMFTFFNVGILRTKRELSFFKLLK